MFKVLNKGIKSKYMVNFLNRKLPVNQTFSPFCWNSKFIIQVFQGGSYLKPTDHTIKDFLKIKSQV